MTNSYLLGDGPKARGGANTQYTCYLSAENCHTHADPQPCLDAKSRCGERIPAARCHWVEDHPEAVGSSCEEAMQGVPRPVAATQRPRCHKPVSSLPFGAPSRFAA